MLYDGWRFYRLPKQDHRQSTVIKVTLLSVMVGIASCQQPSDLEQSDSTVPAPAILNTTEVYPPNELTIITPANSLSGNSALVQVAENSTRVIQVEAKGLPDSQLSYRLQDGADMDKFVINEATGELAFREVPDWEAPTDENRDNNYVVNWQVVSSDGSTRSQFMIVKVADLED